MKIKTGKKIKTMVGDAVILRAFDIKCPCSDKTRFEFECPLGRGRCVFSRCDIMGEGRMMCGYCRRENPILQEKSYQDKVEDAARRAVVNRPKRGDVETNISWKTLRYEVLKRDGGKCVLCGRGAADGVKLHVDHIKPASVYPELYYDINNLQTLCEDCNLGKSDGDDIDWRV